jgi:hypothetical protein
MRYIIVSFIILIKLNFLTNEVIRQISLLNSSVLLIIKPRLLSAFKHKYSHQPLTLFR